MMEAVESSVACISGLLVGPMGVGGGAQRWGHCVPPARGAARRVKGPQMSETAVYVGVVTSGWSDAELDRLIEEVLVDAYGDSEQARRVRVCVRGVGPAGRCGCAGSGVLAGLVEFNGDERRGLVAYVTISGQRRRVGLVELQVTDQGHEAARLMAAFERWWVRPDDRSERRGRWRLRWSDRCTSGGNERLRGLLGLTEERSADPPVAWEPTLFSPPRAERPVVDRHSSPADKISTVPRALGA